MAVRPPDLSATQTPLRLSVSGLRLVGVEDAERSAPSSVVRGALHPDQRDRPDRRGRDAVANENRSAAAMPPLDAHTVFATLVRSRLDGGRAAILRPEARRELLAVALHAGVRPFHAHLIIALVQDQARGAHPPPMSRPAPPAVLGLMTPDPRANPRPRAERSHDTAYLWLCSLVTAGTILAAVSWVVAAGVP